MGFATRRASAALLSACLVAGGLTTTAAQEPPGPPWFGERAEMPGFALTIPDDWFAVDIDGDLQAQSKAISDQLHERSGVCGTPACEAGFEEWFEGEDETVRMLLNELPADWASDYEIDECRVHGPGSLNGRSLGEISGLVHDLFARSEGIDAADLPRPLTDSDLDTFTFDLIAPDLAVVGTVYVWGDGGRFAWIGCEGRTPPEDSWRSIADTFEFLPESGDGATASTKSELQDMLPIWVGSRGLLSYSSRGLDYLRDWSRMSDEQLATIEEDPGTLEELFLPGIELDDFEFANAGRASTDDPAYFATAVRVRGIPAQMLPLSMVVDHADAGTWTTARFGDREVQVGTEAMLKQHARPGRPYVYDVGEVRFVITTDDEAWAAEAIAHLRPDAVTENASLFVSLPDSWQPGLTPTLDEGTRAGRYEEGILTAAHDGSRLSSWYVPTLEVYFGGTRLDADVAATLDRWAEEYPEEPWRGRTLRSLERINLPAGEALRLELIGEAGEPPQGVSEIRYVIASPAGVFDLLFSAAEADLPDYEATFDTMARSFLQTDPDPEGRLARLGRGELTRAEYEMLAGGYTVVPEHVAPASPSGDSGPVVLGGRIEVPAGGFALEVPDDWHAVDVTRPDAAALMEVFDETTQNLHEGRLTPESALKRGTFAISGEGYGGFTTAAIDELVTNGSSDTFDLVALAPWDGVSNPHECAIYWWYSDGESVLDEATATAEGLRGIDYEVTLEEVKLPAGDAVRLDGTGAQWQNSIWVVARDDQLYFLECGHRHRHQQQWQAIAESLEFLSQGS